MEFETVADHLQNREVVIRGIIDEEASPPKILELITFIDFTQRGQTMWPGVVRIEFTGDRPEVTQLITPTDIEVGNPYDFLDGWEGSWDERNIFGFISEDPVIVIKRVNTPGIIPFDDGFEELSELNRELLELLDTTHSALRDKLATTEDELQQLILRTICERLLGLIKHRKIKRDRTLKMLG